jgi:glutathione synthase/RimK-type ligase-like ATP-grasp enzyme
MKIAIHYNAYSFSVRWIQYCKDNQIPYKIVNCYSTDIIQQLDDCDALMWHHNHGKFEDLLFSKKLLFALEHSGKKVFPDFATAWHFDDKIGQKYLFESIKAPLVPSYLFYNLNDAVAWIKQTSFPKVFKLSTGAGSYNVRLVKTEKEAISITKQAFKKGFINYNATLHRERGYVYFQDFLPNNAFDIRIIVIGERAFAIKRLNRENDFRASGSGRIIYDKAEMPEICVKMSFEMTQRLHSQSAGYDFLFDKDNNPLITEISYGFTIEVYDPCPGYWDKNMIWHEGKFIPQAWMVEDLIASIKNK